MTDRPIIFSAPMVRALLEGRKTMTRRVLKPQPEPWKGIHGEVGASISDWSFTIGNGKDPRALWAQTTHHMDRIGHVPYAIGDRLWVRETFRQAYPKTSFGEGFVYRADKPRALGMGEYSDHQKWKPSIFMPRRLSRLTLTVTDVRVQRLQEISEEDAFAETGQCELEYAEGPAGTMPCGYGPSIPIFQDLWNTIHGPDAWDANPWIVALTFTAEQRNIDAK